MYKRQVVYDCLPAGFSLPVQTFAPSAGTVDPVTPAVNCSITGSGANVRVVQPDPLGTGTLIKWNVGKITATEPQSLTFRAVIDPDAAGGESYTNSAHIVGPVSYTHLDVYKRQPWSAAEL